MEDKYAYIVWEREDGDELGLKKKTSKEFICKNRFPIGTEK